MRVYPPDAAISDWLIDQPRRYIVGRGEQADCRVADRRVSREHLALDLESQPWRVSDLGSKNGTRLNGRPLDSLALPEHCWLSLGGVPAHFETLNPERADRLRRTRRDRIEQSQRMLARLTPGLDHEQLLDTTLNDYLALAECSRGGLFLLEADGKQRLARAMGLEQGEGSLSVIAEVLESATPRIIADVRREQALAERESIVAGAIETVVCIPLRVGESTLGALYADSNEPGKQFSALDLELMQALARQAAFVLALGRMRDDILAMRRTLPGSLEEAEADGKLIRLLERSAPATRR